MFVQRHRDAVGATAHRDTARQFPFFDGLGQRGGHSPIIAALFRLVPKSYTSSAFRVEVTDYEFFELVAGMVAGYSDFFYWSIVLVLAFRFVKIMKSPAFSMPTCVVVRPVLLPGRHRQGLGFRAVRAGGRSGRMLRKPRPIVVRYCLDDGFDRFFAYFLCDLLNAFGEQFSWCTNLPAFRGGAAGLRFAARR